MLITLIFAAIYKSLRCKSVTIYDYFRNARTPLNGWKMVTANKLNDFTANGNNYKSNNSLANDKT